MAKVITTATVGKRGSARLVVSRHAMTIDICQSGRSVAFTFDHEGTTYGVSLNELRSYLEQRHEEQARLDRLESLEESESD